MLRQHINNSILFPVQEFYCSLNTESPRLLLISVMKGILIYLIRLSFSAKASAIIITQVYVIFTDICKKKNKFTQCLLQHFSAATITGTASNVFLCEKYFNKIRGVGDLVFCRKIGITFTKQTSLQLIKS